MEPHTEAKHRIWRIHLEGWLPTISGGIETRVLIIDGFAGPGEYDGGEDGSPIIALKALLGHKYIDLTKTKKFVFVFLDEHRDRVQHLENVAIPNRIGDVPSSIHVRCSEGEFKEVVTEILDDLDSRKARLAPSIILVDPFGWSGIPMSLMHRILDQPKAELLITFMVDSVNRWLTHPDAREGGPLEAHYDALFGTSEWRTVPDQDDRCDRLRELYERQLRTKARFVRGFRMRSMKNKPIYDLIFAGNHIQGMKKIKYAMWKVDPMRGGSFSDRAAYQPSLFSDPAFAEPDTTPLDAELIAEFGGQSTTIEKIEFFTEADTDFRESHVRKRLQLLEETGKIIVLERPGKKRRGRTYPPGTEIKFL